MNQQHHFVTTLEDLRIHFIHERGEGPRPLPILLSHGWPDSFLRVTKLIPRLTTPAAFGADPADSFDVVVPSIPGFGFSERPSSKGFWHKRVAYVFAELMDGLGYKKYGAHGGDWGSNITEQIAFHHGGSLLGIHLTDVPFWHMLQHPGGLTRAEEKYIEEGKNWQMEEGAYALLQATKPQTLAFAINDSPVGLAAWIIEKFRTWSDCGGDVESKFTKNELLNNVMIYWVSQTGGSSARLYYEAKITGRCPRRATSRPRRRSRCFRKTSDPRLASLLKGCSTSNNGIICRVAATSPRLRSRICSLIPFGRFYRRLR